MNQAIQINQKDNVATVIQDVSINQKVAIIDKDGNVLMVLNPRTSIELGHKIALRDITRGELVFKYGFPIGKATVNIKVGSHVHIHNIESQKGRGDLGKISRGEKEGCQ